MNVMNFANLFHQNSIFQPGKPLRQVLSQSPVTDTLHHLSKNLLTAQDQSQDLRKRFDTLELSAEATERKENSALRDVPEGLLHFYLNQCKVGANLSQTQEVSLLEATKAAREQFLQKGAVELNRLSDEGPTPKEPMGAVYGMLVEDDGSGDGDTRWQIDRALASAHKATSTFQKGASSILVELKRRGCVQEGEDFSLDNQWIWKGELDARHNAEACGAGRCGDRRCSGSECVKKAVSNCMKEVFQWHKN